MVFYTNVVKYCERFVPGNIHMCKGKLINWYLMCLVIQHVKIPGSPFLSPLYPSCVQKQRSQFSVFFAGGRHYKGLSLVPLTFLASSSVQIFLLGRRGTSGSRNHGCIHPRSSFLSYMKSVPLFCQLQRTLLKYLIKYESFLWLPQTYISSQLQWEDEVKVLQSHAMLKCF